MSDPEQIYLQPECCADEGVGRLWCEDDAPVDCEDGKPWVRYVRADIAEAAFSAGMERAAQICDASADQLIGKPEMWISARCAKEIREAAKCS